MGRRERPIRGAMPVDREKRAPERVNPRAEDPLLRGHLRVDCKAKYAYGPKSRVLDMA